MSCYRRAFEVCLSGAVALITASPAWAQGFVDSATSAGLRPAISSGESQTFLPARGPFTFPSPYNTQGFRLTNSTDCSGADCVMPVGYSYWNNINNHAGSDTLLAFLGLDRRKGGTGPTLFSVNKRTGETQNLGPMFSPDSPYSWANGEGWYFSRTRQTTLYLNDGPRLLRYDVQTKAFETVFDVTTQYPGRYIWQIHSSNDDRVHSATLRDSGSYEMLGCVAYREDRRQFQFYAKRGDFDECQVDKSGRWLVIKENLDGRNGEDNRIIDLDTGTEHVLLDENGAAGHSDVGYGYLVAEDNFNAQPGAVRVWRFDLDLHGGQPAPQAGQGTLVYQLSSWNSGLGHVAHGNARAGASLDQQVACASNAHRQQLPRVNEIVCFRLNGSLDTLVVAPNLSDLSASGGGTDDYLKMPKGNLDVTGEYFIWTANAGSNRLDAYIVRVPLDRLGQSPSSPPPASSTPAPSAPTPSPTPAPPPPSTTAPSFVQDPVRWTSAVNVSISGNSITKTGGCSGCPDAGAASEQQIGSGSGGVFFTVTETNSLRFMGLTSGTASHNPGDMKFALRLQSGVAEVREAGAYRSDIRVSAGDVLGVTVSGGTVQYSRNGEVFYTSSTPVQYPLRVDTTIYESNGTISNAVLMTAAVAGQSAATVPAATSSSPSRATSSGSPTGNAVRRAIRRRGGVKSGS